MNTFLEISKKSGKFCVKRMDENIVIDKPFESTLLHCIHMVIPLLHLALTLIYNEYISNLKMW